MVLFPFRNGTGSFKMGSGPIQQLKTYTVFRKHLFTLYIHI